MNWSIDIPHYGDRDDPVLEAISAARETMDQNEARIVEVIATDALERGTTSIGALLDEVEQLGVAGQRQLLDDARQRVGLDTTHEVERRREDAAFDRAFERLQPPGPEPWSPLQRCAICGVYPTKDGAGHGRRSRSSAGTVPSTKPWPRRVTWPSKSERLSA